MLACVHSRCVAPKKPHGRMPQGGIDAAEIPAHTARVSNSNTIMAAPREKFQELLKKLFQFIYFGDENNKSHLEAIINGKEA